MQVGERVTEASSGKLILFLVTSSKTCNSVVLLYDDTHANDCDETQLNSIATGIRNR